jgi:hypothetical protein
VSSENLGKNTILTGPQHCESGAPDADEELRRSR